MQETQDHIQPPHPWNLSAQEAISLQKQLQSAVQLTPIQESIRYIGGADISYNKNSDVIYVGIVLLDYETMQVVAHSTVVDEMTFPYIPGLLSFREVPHLLKAWDKLPIKPQVMMMDGHGIAHPRRFGVACHFGLLTGCPALGCGKTRLTGRFEPVGPFKGDFSPMVHQDETVGFVFRTRDNVKPVFLSPGHLCSLEDCLAIGLHSARGYRIPEPTRQADQLVNKLRRGEMQAGGYSELNN